VSGRSSSSFAAVAVKQEQPPQQFLQLLIGMPENGSLIRKEGRSRERDKMCRKRRERVLSIQQQQHKLHQREQMLLL
jgi:hypothetical protein